VIYTGASLLLTVDLDDRSAAGATYLSCFASCRRRRGLPLANAAAIITERVSQANQRGMALGITHRRVSGIFVGWCSAALLAPIDWRLCS